MYQSLFKKYILTPWILILFIFVPFTSLSFPQKATADAGCAAGAIMSAISGLVGDAVGDLTGASQVPVSSVGPGDREQQRATSEDNFKNCVLIPMAQMVARTAIKSITQSTVNWINSGFEGNPSFIQNPEGFLQGLGDRIAGSMIEDIAPFLCEPFKLDLSLMLAIQFGGTQMQDDIGCTLTEVIGNVDDFVDDTGNQIDNIGNGGWKNWFELTQKQQNNPDGALFKAKAGIGAAIQTSQGTIGAQLSWGDGFFPFQDCSKDAAQNAGVTTAQNGNQTQVLDLKTKKEVYGVSVDQKNCVTKTPGKVIEGQLQKNLGMDLDSLGIAESLDQILSALASQALRQAVNAFGLGSSKGSYTASTPVRIPTIPSGGSCWPSKTIAVVGESITWEGQGSSNITGDVTYEWTGTDLTTPIIAETLAQISVVYSQPGEKRMRITINRDTNVSTAVTFGNLNVINSDYQPIVCYLSVVVSSPTTQQTTQTTSTGWTTLTPADMASELLGGIRFNTRALGFGSLVLDAAIGDIPVGAQITNINNRNISGINDIAGVLEETCNDNSQYANSTTGICRVMITDGDALPEIIEIPYKRQ